MVYDLLTDMCMGRQTFSSPILNAYIISQRGLKHLWSAASQHMVPRLVDPVDKTKEKPNTGLGKERK